MKRWYVVQTKVTSESQAEYHIRNQGFEAYLPRYRKQWRHARKIQHVLRPLFPGYLFVNLDLDLEQWRSINGTVGVQKIIAAGYDPIPVPGGIVERIVAAQDETGAVVMDQTKLNTGDRVQISAGAFVDCEGVFEEMADDRRVILLLDLMGRKVRATIEISALATVA